MSTRDDFHIGVRLRALSVTSRSPPNPRTDHENVTLAREETRIALPTHMRPGERYEGVRVDKRLSGRIVSSRPSSSRTTGRTKEQLYNQAKRLNIEGRSKMTKAQLHRAIGRQRS